MKQVILFLTFVMSIQHNYGQFIYKSTNNVGIGTLSPDPKYALDVFNDIGDDNGTTAAGLFKRVIGEVSTDFHNGLRGVVETNTDFSSGSINSITGISTTTSHQGSGTVDNATGANCWVYTLGSSAGGITNAYALRSRILTINGGSITNGYGLYIDDITSSNDYGIYQTGSDDDNYFAGKVGIGTSSPGDELEVNGDASKTGGGEWDTPSDKRLKRNIRPFEDGLKQILQINPVRYQYIPNYDSSNKEYVGVIAQDMNKVAPYTVEEKLLKLNASSKNSDPDRSINPIILLQHLQHLSHRQCLHFCSLVPYHIFCRKQ